MDSIILSGDSKSNLKLLADLAKKLGLKVNSLTSADMEGLGLLAAMQKGRTGEYVDTDEFIRRYE